MIKERKREKNNNNETSKRNTTQNCVKTFTTTDFIKDAESAKLKCVGWVVQCPVWPTGTGESRNDHVILLALHTTTMLRLLRSYLCQRSV